MAFISGIQILNAPASALNNSGQDPSSSTENVVVTKHLFVNRKAYPYVSAQAYRRWLRETLEAHGTQVWPRSPVFREEKVAYTDANPILYCDDDLFGYMRAEGSTKEAADSRAERVDETPMQVKGKKKVTVTRVSPFRVGTLVALSDGVAHDSGYMSRHEGNPVPHGHQFYRASLEGMFSLDLRSAGRFTYEDRTGYKNLDSVRIELAKEKGLEPIEEEKAYKLSDGERVRRVATLLRAMPVITGGAKMAVHYTDVSPAVVLVAVTKGGNNPFQYAITGDKEGRAKVDLEALKEVADVWGDTLLSPLYIGWVKGYASDNRRALKDALDNEINESYPRGVKLDHPKRVLEALASSLEDHPQWLD